MKEYLYNDFLNILNKTGQSILPIINDYISTHYPAYRPFDIKPENKSMKEWKMNYRKKPKVGKAICSVFSIETRLSFRFSLLSSMVHEILLRQNEFSEKIRNNTLKQLICTVNKSCRSYGGNNICPFRQYFWINKRLIMACPYPWVTFNDLEEKDITDVFLFMDIQMKHMVQDSKDIKGSLYAETNIQRCKDVQSVVLDEFSLDIDLFEINDHVKKVERLNKYTKLYNLVPMGERNGLWYYISDDSVCGLDHTKNEYSYNKIPKGRYAVVIIEDPFTFSFNRVWNYVCKWVLDNHESINGFNLEKNKNIACFSRFYMESSKEKMALYVTIK
jgi:predicted transcriptional regulator YdeE